MRFKLVFNITAVALVGIAATLLAQQPGGQQRRPGGPGGGGGGGFFTQSRMGLLNIDEVQKELELADEQIEEIRKVAAQIREKYPFGGRGGGGDGQKGRRPENPNNENAFVAPAQWYFVQAQQPNQQGQGQGRGRGGQPSPEDMARFEQQRLERTREENARLAEILLPQQIKRLNEIYVQQAGTAALQDEDVAKELGISDAQKAKLAEVRAANQEAMRSQGRELYQPGGDPEANRARIAEFRRANDAKLIAVLSSDQQKKFEAMKGKPFAMPERAPGGPGGPGGGNRGKRGNDN